MKPEIVMIGTCPQCDKEFKRKPPVDVAVCLCATLEAEAQGRNPLPEPITVPLSPAVELSNREHAFFSRAAQFTGVKVEEFVNAFMIEAAKQKLSALQPFPQIVVTTKER